MEKPIKEVILSNDYDKPEETKQILKLILELGDLFNQKKTRLRKNRLKRYQEFEEYFNQLNITNSYLIQGCFLITEIINEPKLCYHLKLNYQLVFKYFSKKVIPNHHENSPFQIVRPQPRKLLRDLILNLYQKKLIV